MEKKMKKIIKSATLLLCAVMLLTSLSACSIFNDFSNNGGNSKDHSDTQTKAKTEAQTETKTEAQTESSPKTQTITVYNGDTAMTYKATFGKTAKIDVFRKSGYYFVGAYDSPNGGMKYFDCNGNSTVVWGVGNPDTYYVRYESIYNVNYVEKQRSEDPYKWDGVSEKCVSFEFSDALNQAISANLDRNVIVTVSVDISCDDSWMFQKIALKTMKSGGETYVLGTDLQLAGGTYKTFTYSASIPARLLQSGEIHLYLKGLNSNLLTLAYYYYKNVSVAIVFENT